MLLAMTVSQAAAQVVPPQIEQARRLDQPQINALRSETAAPAAAESAVVPDDAFGAQVLMKETPKPKPFTITLEAAPYYTSNVALSRRSPLGDTFLSAIGGVNWRRPLSPVLAFDADVRETVYRYDRYRQLDFQSLVAAGQLTYTPRRLRNTALYTAYSFTQLTAADFGAEFFNQHAVTVGIQRAFPLSGSHGFVVGASAMWTWTDSDFTKRDEYGIHVGYRASLSRKISLNASYHGAVYVYSESQPERNDLNQSLSLGLRYDFTKWSYLTVGTSAVFNRSDEAAFDYDVWNVGGSLGISASF